MTPGSNSDFPGGYVFGRELFSSSERSVRWLGSLDASSGTVDQKTDNKGYSNNPASQSSTSITTNLTRQWVRYKRGTSTITPSFGFGPSIGLSYASHSWDETYYYADTTAVQQTRNLSTSDLSMTVGMYASLEANWEIRENLFLIATYGIRFGVGWSKDNQQMEMKYPDYESNNYSTDEDSNTWNFFARTQTAALGLTFIL